MHHQAGRLETAEALYKRVLKVAPRNADALNLLGVIAQGRGQVGEAKVLYSRAIASNPDVPDFHYNLGNLLSSREDTDGALAAYKHAIALRPGFADAHLNMGVLLHKAERLEAAAACFRKSVVCAPRDPRGYFNLGRCEMAMARLGEAEANLRRAVEANPDYLAAHVLLSSIYTKTERLSEAIAHLRRAIEIDSKPEYFSNLGDLLKSMGDLDGALAAHLVAVAAKPNEPAVLHNYGATLHALKRFDEARQMYLRALGQDPGFVEAYVGLAKVYEHQHLLSEAMATLRQALLKDPGSPNILSTLALLQLLTGELGEGWRNYEYRTATNIKPLPKRSEPPAYWRGESLTGKSILLWTEQGPGDEILFSSMAPDIMARAGRCIIECTPRMVPVLARSFPQATVAPFYVQGVAATPPEGIDYQISVASLGQFVRPDFASFPKHRGYLNADAARTETLRVRYRALIPGNRVVGISWRSRNEEIGAIKSADLSLWDDVLTVPGITFVNLQYGECGDELAAVKRRLGVDVFHDSEIDSLKNMDDFFAQVAAMDLVISTSNTTVHVAGSLNVPTWLLLSGSRGGLWYWFLNRADSPWYPAVRILQARAPGEGIDDQSPWDEVMARTADDLRDHVRDPGGDRGT